MARTRPILITALSTMVGAAIILTDPMVVIGLFIGGILPFFIAALTMTAVGRAAGKMVEIFLDVLVAVAIFVRCFRGDDEVLKGQLPAAEVIGATIQAGFGAQAADVRATGRQRNAV